MPSEYPDERRAKRFALLVCAIVVLVLLAPVVRNFEEKPADGFPLSHYPMFTKKRGETTTLYYLVGIRRDGSTVRIPATFAGPGGMNSVRKQIRRMCKLGEAGALAESVYATLAADGALEANGILEVHVVKAKFSISDYAHVGTSPLRRRSLGSAGGQPEGSR